MTKKTSKKKTSKKASHDQGRFSAKRKTEAVLRLLRGDVAGNLAAAINDPTNGLAPSITASSSGDTVGLQFSDAWTMQSVSSAIEVREPEPSGVAPAEFGHLAKVVSKAMGVTYEVEL